MDSINETLMRQHVENKAIENKYNLEKLINVNNSQGSSVKDDLTLNQAGNVQVSVNSSGNLTISNSDPNKAQNDEKSKIQTEALEKKKKANLSMN